MRYEIKEELTKVGRKTERQWVLFDTVENRVFARFSDEKQAKSILNRWYAAQLAAEENA